MTKDSTITAHEVDVRGVYLRSETLSIYAAQPKYAVYAALPDAQEGHTRMWIDGAWRQVPDAEVPPLPEPEPAPDPVPQRCTRRQGLLALLTYGIKRSDIEAQIEAIEDEMEREAAWIEYLADTWDLGNPRLQAMWAALGGTPEQLPQLFRLAVTL